MVAKNHSRARWLAFEMSRKAGGDWACYRAGEHPLTGCTVRKISDEDPEPTGP